MNFKDKRSKEDYYQILSLNRDATSWEIKSAYRKLALMYHPDVNPGNEKALFRFREITRAYEVLIDSVKRREYDLFLDRCNEGRDDIEGFNGFDREGNFDDKLREAWVREFFDKMRNEGRLDKKGEFLRDKLTNGFIYCEFLWEFLHHFSFRHIGKNRDKGDWFNITSSKGNVLKELGNHIMRGFYNTVRQTKVFWDTVGGEKGYLDDNPAKSFILKITARDAKSGVSRIFVYSDGRTKRQYRISIPPGIKGGTKLRVKENNQSAFVLKIVIED